jgi:hypothetical protein
MNILSCEKYLVKMDFNISVTDIAEYNQSFKNCCAELREKGEIISKDQYSDAELCFYSTKVMNVLEAAGDPMILKLRYLLAEGFLRLRDDGCIYENKVKFKPLTESDFSRKEAA